MDRLSHAYSGFFKRKNTIWRDFSGAQSRDRTSDTAIFNRMLYQLSYLGVLETAKTASPRRAYRRRMMGCPAIQLEIFKESSGLIIMRRIRSICVFIIDGNSVAAIEPSPKIDICTAF
jgi:hypothetical protein